MDFSADGKFVVAAAEGAADMTLWDVGRGFAPQGTLAGHTRPLVATAFARDSRFMASIAHDLTLRVWVRPRSPGSRLACSNHVPHSRCLARSNRLLCSSRPAHSNLVAHSSDHHAPPPPSRARRTSRFSTRGSRSPSSSSTTPRPAYPSAAHGRSSSRLTTRRVPQPAPHRYIAALLHCCIAAAQSLCAGSTCCVMLHAALAERTRRCLTCCAAAQGAVYFLSLVSPTPLTDEEDEVPSQPFSPPRF
jgi:hypothetical protein